MELPDVLGFELKVALLALAEKGIQVQDINTTKPVKESKKSSIARVVRIDRVDDWIIRVVVA